MSGNLIRYNRLHCKPAMMVSNPEEKVEWTVQWRDIIHGQQNALWFILKVSNLLQRCRWQCEWSESWTAWTYHYFPLCPCKVRSRCLLCHGCSSTATQKKQKKQNRTEISSSLLWVVVAEALAKTWGYIYQRQSGLQLSRPDLKSHVIFFQGQ